MAVEWASGSSSRSEEDSWWRSAHTVQQELCLQGGSQWWISTLEPIPNPLNTCKQWIGLQTWVESVCTRTMHPLSIEDQRSRSVPVSTRLHAYHLYYIDRLENVSRCILVPESQQVQATKEAPVPQRSSNPSQTLVSIVLVCQSTFACGLSRNPLLH